MTHQTALLEQALEFIEGYEDVADGSDGPQANRAMVLASEIRAALSHPAPASEAQKPTAEGASDTPPAKEADELPEKLAALGWQAIECEICGASARAFPKPAAPQPARAGAVELSDEQIINELEAAGVGLQSFMGGISGNKHVHTTAGSVDVAKIIVGIRAILAAATTAASGGKVGE